MRFPAPVYGTANMIGTVRSSMHAQVILILGLMRTLGADSHNHHHHHTPLETMADVTNDFGVCVLQVISSPSTNTVFSPYGLVSMALLVYEGATGQSAAEIYNTLHLPWHRDIVRIGFRDLHRYLRSYFSAEGFLKGLVLSKPNATLRLSYIEVLKFYGFQPDTSITQPIPTQPPVDKDKETTTLSETTTSQPATTTTTSTDESTTVKDAETTIKSSETVTPEKESKTIPPTTATSLETTTINLETTTTSLEETKTSLETTTPSLGTTETSLETTTLVMTLTNEPQNMPEVLDMKGENMTVSTTQLPQTTVLSTEETTMLTSTAKETTKSETAMAESTETHKTTMEITPEKYTTEDLEPTTEEMKQTTSISSENTITQDVLNQETTQSTTVKELETEPSTTEINIVTVIDEIAPTLQNMNMVSETSNKTEETIETTTEPKVQAPSSDAVDETNETTTSDEAGTETTGFTLSENGVITTDEQISHTISDDMTISTIFVDSTVPIEEFVILTTPPDVEILTEKVTSMLEALVLMEEGNLQKQSYLTTDASSNKRSTVTGNEEVIKKPLAPENTIILNYLYSNIDKTSGHQSQVQTKNQSDMHADNKEEMVVSKSTTHSPNNHFGEHLHESVTSSLEEITSGFPTLEPDTIIFPTIKDPRLPRAIKGEGKPAQLGNWVGDAASGWHPSPTDQWFWTYSGDKLVPVLTHSAYLPHAELPSLRASALQLPLDDVRYALVILLPNTSRGLKQMLYSLQWHSLRDILKSMKLTPVYSVVPSFTIVKHINLTPALYKLGIRHIFDAYLANLSELSPEPNLYVRTVEQVITISVQKYFTNHKWVEASPSQVQQHFLATHPFAYFVVDVETKVALIAGTIVDPLLRSS
ncbi:cell wall protein DAN4-like [Homalodisca vitripennis]|nr:cell wall protein DAN4-like [Homalodisca vitripennis]